MYVRDLEPGCLLLPDSKYWWNVSEHRVGHYTNSSAAVSELHSEGIMHSGTIQYDHRGNKKGTIGVYIGTKVLKNYYLGVKKQHIVLVNNMLCVIDGYQFSNCKKL